MAVGTIEPTELRPESEYAPVELWFTGDAIECENESVGASVLLFPVLAVAVVVELQLLEVEMEDEPQLV